MRQALVAVVTIASLVLGACQAGSPPSARRPPIPPGQSGGTDSDQAVISDPCAGQLHDICGAILMYYSLNKRLPAKLEDLQAMADAGAPLSFTCPVSHQPYVYVPAGLSAPDSAARIIVYDPAPSHGGQRWCIVLLPSKGSSSTVTLDVLSIPERVFQTYQPAAPAAQ